MTTGHYSCFCLSKEYVTEQLNQMSRDILWVWSTVRSQCLWSLMFGILTSQITHIHAVVSTFYDCFWWITMRPNGWWLIFLPYHAIVQITLSSMKISLSLSEVGCLHAAWNGILPESFNVYCAFKKCVCFIDKLTPLVLCEVILYVYCWCFTILWNKCCILCWVWVLTFVIPVLLSAVVPSKSRTFSLYMKWSGFRECKISGLVQAPLGLLIGCCRCIVCVKSVSDLYVFLTEGEWHYYCRECVHSEWCCSSSGADDITSSRTAGL